MSHICRFIIGLLFFSFSFKVFAEEDEVDFSLKKITEEEKVFFESFQDLYKSIKSRTGATRLESARLEPLVILSESETSLTFGMAQSVCRSYNVFSAISGKSCYVAKAQGVDRIQSILRYGKKSPSYGSVNINADFLIMNLKDLYYAQRRQGRFAELSYLNAVMYLNSSLYMFFVHKDNKDFKYLSDLVSYVKKPSKDEDDKDTFSIGVLKSNYVAKLTEVADDFSFLSSKVKIVTLKPSSIEKRFCNKKTADIDVIFYVGGYYEETLSSFYNTCSDNVALLAVNEDGYEEIKSKQFYAPTDVTNILKYKIKRNTLSRLGKTGLLPQENQEEDKPEEKERKEVAEDLHKYNSERLYVLSTPYVLAATRYTNVKDVFYVVMSYTYDFDSAKDYQPALDTHGLNIVDLFSRPVKTDDLVFHNAVVDYLDYYEVYSLSTRKSESEVKLIKFMSERERTDLKNIAGPLYPNEKQLDMIKTGSKEILFYNDSYLLDGFLERDFNKVKEEKIYGNATSGRFKVNGTLYEAGYIDVLAKMKEESLTQEPKDTEEDGIEKEDTENVDVDNNESQPAEEEQTVTTDDDNATTDDENAEPEQDVFIDPLLGGQDSLF